MVNKWVLWGGAGVAVLAGGFLLLRGGSQSQASDGGSAFYPPTVYGGASTPASAIDTTSGTSTDNSIAQLIASNLSIAQTQSNTTLATAQMQKDVSLATLDQQKQIAFAANDTQIKNTLAGQIGTIVSKFSNPGSILGTIDLTGNQVKIAVGKGGSIKGNITPNVLLHYAPNPS